MTHLLHAARTDVGRIRAVNEDSLLAVTHGDRGLYVVADGMGGHAAGDVASAMAVEIVAREVADLAVIDPHVVPQLAARALALANAAIHERTHHDAATHGMGTTVSFLIISHGKYWIGHVGDSRVYLLRDGKLVQLTKDHSFVQEQVDAGTLTPAQARRHPYASVITRSVGTQPAVVSDLHDGEVRTGDVFLVASDGLTGMVEDRRVRELLLASAPPERTVDALIAEANGRGGHDNISAIVVEVVDANSNGELVRTTAELARSDA